MRTAYAIAYQGYPVTAEIEAIAEHAKALPPAVKATLMFAAGPLLGLAFVTLLPVVGLALAAWLGIRALVRSSAGTAAVLKRIGLFLISPFIGLAYLIAFPFVGIGLLAYYGARAARRQYAPA